ncbi:MAG: DUF6702 family protein [Bacteroidota bacterium]
MRIKVIIFTIACFVFSGFTWEHPLKMSFSYLRINSNGIVNLETRIFLDDLTAHMQKLYGLEEVDFSNLSSNGTQALGDYFPNHFYFQQGEEKLNFTINDVSLTFNGLALVLHLSLDQPLNGAKEARLINTLLCDADSRQKNSVKFGGRQYELSYSNPHLKLVPGTR